MNTRKKKSKSSKPKKVVSAKDKPKKAATRKEITRKIVEVVVPVTSGKTPLVTPLPQREVKNFGAMPFEEQAKLILNTLPVEAAEVVGKSTGKGINSLSLQVGS